MYNHQDIEPKWQKRWEDAGIFHAQDDSDKPPFYTLIEFPYPSGDGLHVGHPRSYTALDVLSRKRRAEGFNVLYPIGWDAFGLPTENYAIKTGRKPQEVTAENVATFKRQLQSLGMSFDWSREINTTDPSYYKWTQWMFLKFFEAGLAYKDKIAINWCMSCKIGLANEEVVNGKCERCGGEVEKRDKEQWMIAITKYADKLLDGLNDVDYLPQIKKQQENWIGRSEGAEVLFKLDGHDESMMVFTTRPDTLFGATYMVLAPEHALVEKITIDEKKDEVAAYVKEAGMKTDIERGAEDKEKTGVFTGAYAINPVTGEKIPVWVADYVMMGYGTGAIMAVPAHDERDFAFANAFGLEVRCVINPTQFQLKSSGLPGGPEFEKDEADYLRAVHEGKVCFVGDGNAMNSDFLDGLDVDQAKKKITDWLEEKKLGKAAVNFKLRDWVFSRQRYWGEPIPLVHCDACGWVAVPDDQLPLELPEVEKYEPTDTGDSPLAAIEEWVNTTCPTCGKDAKRETDTMPNWAGSSWYFLRYIDPKNDDAFADPEKLKYWMPVDLYNGGMEHVTLHLLYSRFWNQFLHDQGLVPVSEPYKRRVAHGLVMAENGVKMSKSKGNVVNPDEMVHEYGADALRTYILFMGPFDEAVPWSKNGLVGVRRFLEKVNRYVTDWDESKAEDFGVIVEPVVKKVGDDIEAFKFNTAVSTLMQMINELSGKMATKEQLKKILIVLSPFAPHLSNELWEQLGLEGLVEEQAWPEVDESKLVKDVITMAVQVNGKVRGEIQIAPDAAEEIVKEVALADEKVQKHLEGKEIRKVIYVPGRILNIVVS